jgi:hypothetical protein
MTILRPYIYRHTPYRPPPLYQGLRSRVLQGHRDPGSRVTMGYRVIGSRVLLGHRVTGLSGLLPAFSPLPVSPWSPWSRVTGYHESPSPWLSGHRVTITMVSDHQDLGSRGHHGYRVMGHHKSPSPGSRVIGLSGHPSPWVSGLGSIWSRVTGHHGHRVSMVTG